MQPPSPVTSPVLEKQPPKQICPVIVMPLHPPQRDFFFLSIFSFLFFIPLAIAAVLFSLKTRDANILGDHRKAERSSRMALGFAISSIVLGSIIIICYVTIQVWTHKG
ncbi:uncharacterized protein LOC102480886 [Tupaia chinensis]|nr:uncharacterized protein LOC102480886 [Tupaia chinensis]